MLVRVFFDVFSSSSQELNEAHRVETKEASRGREAATRDLMAAQGLVKDLEGQVKDLEAQIKAKEAGASEEVKQLKEQLRNAKLKVCLMTKFVFWWKAVFFHVNYCRRTKAKLCLKLRTSSFPRPRKSLLKWRPIWKTWKRRFDGMCLFSFSGFFTFAFLCRRKLVAPLRKRAKRWTLS